MNLRKVEIRERFAMEVEGKRRVVIENVKPQINCGRFPIKRVVGKKVIVTADIFSDGHDSISARLLYRRQKDKEWREVPFDHETENLMDYCRNRDAHRRMVGISLC